MRCSQPEICEEEEAFGAWTATFSPCTYMTCMCTHTSITIAASALKWSHSSWSCPCMSFTCSYMYCICKCRIHAYNADDSVFSSEDYERCSNTQSIYWTASASRKLTYMHVCMYMYCHVFRYFYEFISVCVYTSIYVLIAVSYPTPLQLLEWTGRCSDC